MIKFNYCGTHIKDEEYMNYMSSKGYQVKSLVEGFWNFEKGKPNEYTYRIFYFRGMSKESIEKKIQDLQKNIAFVHRYSFWAIFRSKKNFNLYKQNEQLKLCEKIRQPMLLAAIICSVLIIILILLTIKLSKLFLIPLILLTIYFLICLYLMIQYTKLINSLKDK